MSAHQLASRESQIQQVESDAGTSTTQRSATFPSDADAEDMRPKDDEADRCVLSGDWTPNEQKDERIETRIAGTRGSALLPPG
eukprot:2848498-Prorocentrum_lima.AAC.1